jgi:hypothetical protein
MVRTAVHFVDFTIPGLSASEFVSRACDAIQATIQTAADGAAAGRRAHALRHDLRALDANQLRDIGLDRGAC